MAMKGTIRVNFDINSDSLSKVYSTLRGMIEDYNEWFILRTIGWQFLSCNWWTWCKTNERRMWESFKLCTAIIGG